LDKCDILVRSSCQNNDNNKNEASTSIVITENSSDQFEEDDIYSDLSDEEYNNGIEAWHCAFNGTVKNAHPTIYKLIKEFTLEQQSVELWIKQASSGETNKQSKKQIAVNERIKNVCLSYNSENIMEFFNNLYPNLKN
jgi:hypothetical protein